MKTVNLYKMGLKVMNEKERLSKAIVLQPTDFRYKEFLKYRKEWIDEIKDLEKEYIDNCILYNNEPLPEVLKWH